MLNIELLRRFSRRRSTCRGGIGDCSFHPLRDPPQEEVVTLRCSPFLRLECVSDGDSNWSRPFACSVGVAGRSL